MSACILDKQSLREKVCEECPGTCWGKKATCSVHNLHIGKVESCPQWDKFLAEQQGLRDHDGQLAFTDIEPTLEWVQRTEGVIRGYRSMINKATRLRRELDQAIVLGGTTGNSGVAQYGIEATLPKGKGQKLTALLIPEELYEKKARRLKELEHQLSEVDKAVATIHDEQERIVLESLLDGTSMVEVATILGVSRQRAYEIKDAAVRKLAWALYGDKEVA